MEALSPSVAVSPNASPLPRRPLGRTGLLVPPVLYGTSCLGNLYEAIPYETKKAMVRGWIAALGTPLVLDSAGKYGAGMALETLGRILRELGFSSNDLILSNKLGWYRVPLTGPEPTFEPGAWIDLDHDAVSRIDYEGVLACFEQGNELLGKPYGTSLAAVHDPDEYLAAAKSPEKRKKRWEDVLGAYRALGELKAAGKVKAVGVGSKDWTVIRDLADAVDLDWVMLACSFTVHRHPEELRSFMSRLEKGGVGIINSAVFNAGFLTGGSHYDYRKVDPTNPADAPLFAWRESFHGLCHRHGVDVSAACVQFAIRGPGVVALALNTSKPEKIPRNNEQVAARLPGAFWREAMDLGLVAKSCDFVFG